MKSGELSLLDVCEREELLAELEESDVVNPSNIDDICSLSF